MTQTVTLTIGVPGSGKTTLACEVLKRDPNAVKFSLDDFRTALFGSKKAYWSDEVHRERRKALLHRSYRHAIGTAILGGFSPVIADTNLRWDVVRPLLHLVAGCRHGRDLRVVAKVIRPIDLPALVERNLNRPEDDRLSAEVTEEYWDLFHDFDQRWWTDERKPGWLEVETVTGS